MHSSISRLYYLFQQYKNASLTPGERLELMEMINDPAHEEVVKKLIGEEIDQLDQAGLQIADLLSKKKADRIFAGINLSVAETPVIPLNESDRKNGRWLTRMVAAAVLLLVAGGVYFWIQPSPKKSSGIAGGGAANGDIQPGGDKAVLMLANGSTIILDNAQLGQLADQGNSTVLKTDSGLLVYKPGTVQQQSPAIQFNTLSTPRGGQYQLVLPDGSRVWLNAESSIRFPTAFTGNERKVEITGEVYFEITPTPEGPKIPFIVNVPPSAGSGASIEVLGTHFNVMAYPDETKVKTTLLEGSVKVSSGTATVTLKPGQEAEMDATGLIKLIEDADMYGTVAWKDHLFWFENDDIQTVMRQLARWYDVDVQIEGDIPDHFTGSIPRKSSLSRVFDVLQKTGSIRFTIEDRKIIVSP